MPSGSGEIREASNPCNRGKEKLLGYFSHCRMRDGVLTGLQVKDGPEMRITSETITVDGYDVSWMAVTEMDTNRNRYECAAWVWQLICEGKFESHRRAQNARGFV